ncbi:MAG TPA: shikimate dehydrogenase [Actinobacteria bacterium]|nr:shikimate dehydrogenase [Actinomycetota bacterium]
MLRIDGNTKLVGIIGYPLEHTLSPTIQNAAFAHLGLNWCYLALTVESKHLEDALNGLCAIKNFVGANVTMPYKEKVFSSLDEVSSYAQIVGAVNTLHIRDDKIIGYNTDGRGFLTALVQDGGYNPKDKNVLIVGAGGAARSIAVTLALSGVNELKLLNRTRARAEELHFLLRNNFPCEVKVFDFQDDLESIFSSAELIINATPIGMSEEAYPFPVELISNKHFICDLIYKPLETPLLAAAKKIGVKTMGGLSMLLHQGAAAFEIWTNLNPPLEVMRRAIKDVLALENF